jgi:hypothetical protein
LLYWGARDAQNLEVSPPVIEIGKFCITDPGTGADTDNVLFAWHSH